MNDMTDNQENNELNINFDEFENFLNSDEVSNIFDDTSVDVSGEQSVNASMADNSDVISFDNLGSDVAGADFSEAKQEPYFEPQVVENEGEEVVFANGEEFSDYESEMVIAEPVTEETFQEEFAAAEPVMEETFQEEVVAAEPVTEETFQEEVVAAEPVTEETFQEEFAAAEPVTEETFQEEVAAAEPVIEETFQEEFVAAEPVTEETFQEEFVTTDLQVSESVGENNLAFDVVSSDNLKYLKWYSGNSMDNIYEFGKSSQSAEFIGSASCNTIHINVGYDTYGWNVQFSDGLSMSLRDVREYQIRNGKLPNSSGQISYGQNILTFENVDRIVIYEAVKYFSYGI